MNSVLLCEGSTDYVLLQYFMRKAYHWEDDRSRQEGVFRIENDQESRKLFCKEHILTVASRGMQQIEKRTGTGFKQKPFCF